MEWILYWLRGYLRFSLRGPAVERFMTLCLYHGLPLRRIRYEIHPSVDISARHFRFMRELCLKSGCIAVLEKKGGFPFFLARNRGKVSFAIGILAAFLLIHGMASHIWNITILGNEVYSDDVLLQYMEENGYETGIQRKTLSCDALEQLLRNGYQRISWVSARVEGTRLIVEIRESEPALVEAGSAPGDLASETEGVITEIVTRSGIPQVKAGDMVAAGQVLISGTVPVYGDDGTILQTYSVTADGDIRLQHALVYQDSFPAYREVHVPDQERKRPWILLGKWYLEIPSFLRAKGEAQGVDRFQSYRQLRLFGDYYLPVYVGITTSQLYHTEKYFYTEEEQLSMAEQRIRSFVEENTRNGILVSSSSKLSVRGETCYVTGELTVNEDAGILVQIPEEEEASEVENETSP